MGVLGCEYIICTVQSIEFNTMKLYGLIVANYNFATGSRILRTPMSFV